jgi:hypothetical protein
MARSRSKRERWSDYTFFTVTNDGKDYTCSYRVSRDKFPMLEVSCEWGSKCDTLKSSPTEWLARQFVRELIVEKAK